MKHFKRFTTLFLLAMSLSMTTTLAIKPADAQEFQVIEAQVLDNGQPREVINVSRDKTEVFEEKYGIHSTSDTILSELMIILIEAFILFVMISLVQNLERIKDKEIRSNQNHNILHRMKKLFSIITIIALTLQLLPSQVNAAPLYNVFFDSGDIIFAASDDVFRIMDASNSYTSTQLYPEPGSTPASLAMMDPNGDMVIIGGTTIAILPSSTNFSTFAAIDTITASGTVSAMQIDQHGNIWFSMFSTNSNEDVIVKAVNDGAGGFNFTEYNLYDSTSYIVDLAIDMLGKIWVIKSDGSNNPALAYCFDSVTEAMCTGSSFSNGTITLPYNGLRQITFTSQNDLVAVSGTNDRLILADRDTLFGTTFTTSSIDTNSAASIDNPANVTVDSADNIWVLGRGTSTELKASKFSSSLTDLNIDTTTTTTATVDYARIAVDKDNDVWILDPSDQYFDCYSSSGVSCGSYNMTIGVANTFANNTDITGFYLNRLYDLVTGQDQVNISASVDPVISFAIRNAGDTADVSTCALGNLNDTGIDYTCSYLLKVSGNAGGGILVYADADNTSLYNANHTFTSAADTLISGGITGEGYGVSHGAITTGTGVNMMVDLTAVGAPNDPTDLGGFLYTTTASNEYGFLSASNTATFGSQSALDVSTVLMTHTASISNLTPAGSYTQTVTYTVVGTF